MTTAQINFLKQKEEARHNQEQERLSAEQIAQQRYATEVSAETSRYAANTAAAASRYAGEQKATATKYSADVNAAQRDRVLEFEKTTQEFKNSIASAELELQKSLNKAQLQQIEQSVRRDLETLRVQAERLKLDQAVAEVDMALKEAQKWERYTAAGRNVSNEVREWVSTIREGKGFAKIKDFLKGW